MRKRNSSSVGKEFSSSRDTISSSERAESSARLPSNYSPPALFVKGAEEFLSSQSFDVQVTVRSKVELSRNQVCKLAGFSLSEVSEKGIGLSDWLILEYLYSYLLGSKQSPLERRDPKEREISLLLKVVLLSGTWMGLGDKRQLPEDVKHLILSSPWCPKGRVKSSWSVFWKLEKFLEIRLVPLDVFLERTKGTSRYSSYCKGYGESSRMGRRQKTKPSAELDGEPVNLEEEQSFVQLRDLPRLFDLILKEIKYQSKKE